MEYITYKMDDSRMTVFLKGHIDSANANSVEKEIGEALDRETPDDLIIDAGELTIRNIDLRRKVSYRRRKSKDNDSKGFANQTHRIGRTYKDYEGFINNTGADVWEMDTVIGSRKRGKRLLTMIFQDNSIMLLFLMPDGKAESVKRVFDYLERGLGIEQFQRLFQVFLTDNGSEFKRPVLASG